MIKHIEGVKRLTFKQLPVGAMFHLYGDKTETLYYRFSSKGSNAYEVRSDRKVLIDKDALIANADDARP